MDKSRLSIIERRMVFKAIVVGVLILIVVILQVANTGLRQQNSKFFNFIKNEDHYQEKLKLLKAKERNWRKYTLQVNKNVDLDRMKSEQMNAILNLLESNNLKADSYDSRQSRQEGYVVFNHSVIAFGKYVDIMRFLLDIQNRLGYMYVKQYRMNRTGSVLIRLDLSLDVFGKTLKK